MMYRYHPNDPIMIGREKFIAPKDKPDQLQRGRRIGGQTRKVQAMVAKIKLPPKLRWW